MKQKTGGMQQAMDVAAQAGGVDDDEVMIAADDAGASAVTQKMGKVLQEEETPDPEKADHQQQPRLLNADHGCAMPRPRKRGRSLSGRPKRMRA